MTDLNTSIDRAGGTDATRTDHHRTLHIRALCQNAANAINTMGPWRFLPDGVAVWWAVQHYLTTRAEGQQPENRRVVAELLPEPQRLWGRPRDATFNPVSAQRASAALSELASIDPTASWLNVIADRLFTYARADAEHCYTNVRLVIVESPQAEPGTNQEKTRAPRSREYYRQAANRLCSSLVWHRTAEGYTFWNTVCNAWRERANAPELDRSPLPRIVYGSARLAQETSVASPVMNTKDVTTLVNFLIESLDWRLPRDIDPDAVFYDAMCKITARLSTYAQGTAGLSSPLALAPDAPRVPTASQVASIERDFDLAEKARVARDAIAALHAQGCNLEVDDRGGLRVWVETPVEGQEWPRVTEL